MPKGGRKPGSRNRKTMFREAMARDGFSWAIAQDISPLQMCILVMRGDPSVANISERQWAACQAALPYTAARLSGTVTDSGQLGQIRSRMDHERRLALLEAGPDGLCDVTPAAREVVPPGQDPSAPPIVVQVVEGEVAED